MILSTAEKLLGEQGYEASTIRAIGARAHIPVASVYHYFSDRHQVDAELLQRDMRELDFLVSAVLAESDPPTLPDTVNAVFDLMLDYFRRHPSGIELWVKGRTATISKLVRAFDATQAGKVRDLLVGRGLVRADLPLLVLQLAFEAADQLFHVAFRNSPDGDDTTIDEARRVVTAYLETYASRAAHRHG